MSIEERVVRLEEQVRQIAKDLELMEERHKEEVAELKEVLKELSKEIKGIQWKIAAATGSGIAIVSLIDHISKFVK
ncbi:hypothetical protein [Thermovibrio ammonificans]